jgi:hypothetical protein
VSPSVSLPSPSFRRRPESRLACRDEPDPRGDAACDLDPAAGVTRNADRFTNVMAGLTRSFVARWRTMR